MVEDCLECLEVADIEHFQVEGPDPEESIFAVLLVQLPESVDRVLGSPSESNSKYANLMSQHPATWPAGGGSGQGVGGGLQGRAAGRT